MNPDSEQFKQLRKLLVLKRHEEPPPGYFNRFSGQVIARIKAGDQADDSLGWLRKLRTILETKPMLTGAFGAAVCALAISGFVFSEDVESTATIARGLTPELIPAAGGNMAVLNQLPHPAQFASSTNPVSPTLRALFDQPQFNAQPASFGFPGN